MPCPSHSTSFYYYKYVWRRAHCAIFFNLLLIISYLFGTDILFNTLFSNTFILYSSLHVRDKDSRPYKITSKIIVLICFLIFTFLHRRRISELYTKSAPFCSWMGHQAYWVLRGCSRSLQANAWVARLLDEGRVLPHSLQSLNYNYSATENKYFGLLSVSIYIE